MLQFFLPFLRRGAEELVGGKFGFNHESGESFLGCYLIF
jgi:hypothetical protein